MPSTLKWIRPSRANVMALWSRIKDGRLKTSAGIPLFQVAKGTDDPDAVYLTWSYDKSAVVRCSIDDIPAYLPSVPFAEVECVLRRIARRDLRPADPGISAAQKAGEAVARITQEAEHLFKEKIVQVCADEEMTLLFMDVVRETLDEMVERKMIKGS